MSKESVKRAVESLEREIKAGNHTCNVQVEDMGDIQEVSFYLDCDPEAGEDADAILAVVTVLESGAGSGMSAALLVEDSDRRR